MTTRTAQLATLIIGLLSLLSAEPLLESWHTSDSGRYARIFETIEDETAGNSVTTWSRGQGTQALPTYGGIHEISYDDSWIYRAGHPRHGPVVSQ